MKKRWVLTLILPAVCLLPTVAHASGGGSGNGLDLVSAIGLAIIAACVLMVVFNLLRLPALLAYIVAGLLLGAVAAPLLGDSIKIMEHISHLGLVFLLFIIGMEMDLRGIVRLGPRAAEARFIATVDDNRTVAKFTKRGVFRTIAPPVHAAPAFAQAIMDALSAGEPNKSSGTSQEG